MNYHIKNGMVLDENYQIKNYGVKIKNGIIEAVGCSLADEDGYDIIDAGLNLIMPGLKNAHTHSAMVLLRGYAEDLPLNEWLFEKVFPFEGKMTGEDVYWGTKLAILEYLRNGITSIGEMYGHMDDYIRAAEDFDYQVTAVSAIEDLSGETEKKLIAYEQNYNKYNNETGNIRAMLGYHAEYTASDKLLGGLSELVKKYKKPLCAHMSETEREVRECLRRRGETPFALADKYGLFDYGGAVYHGVHLTDYELDIIREKNVTVVTNPSSNLKLSSGIADITGMYKRGIKVAVGTDGPASNNSLDMFREMYLVSVLQKYRTGDPSVMPAETVLDMCIKNGGNCLLTPESVLIKPGSRADIIMVDINMPNMLPHNNIVNNLVYSCAGANVIMTMINGKILYKDGVYAMPDAAEIPDRAGEIISRIRSELSR